MKFPFACTYHTSQLIGTTSEFSLSKEQDDMADGIRVLLQELIISDSGDVFLKRLPACLQALRIKFVEGRKCRQI